MKTKKQVILVYSNKKEFNNAIEFLLGLNVKFDGLKNKYIRIRQASFRKNDCIDLYTNPQAVFSSLI